MSDQREDRGLQPERTSLAWQRTGLATVVLCVLLLRLAAASGSLMPTLGAGMLLIVATITVVEGTSRSVVRRAWFEYTQDPPGSARTGRNLSACIVALALLGLAVVLGGCDGENPVQGQVVP